VLHAPKRVTTSTQDYLVFPTIARCLKQPVDHTCLGWDMTPIATRLCRDVTRCRLYCLSLSGFWLQSASRYRRYLQLAVAAAERLSGAYIVRPKCLSRLALISVFSIVSNSSTTIEPNNLRLFRHAYAHADLRIAI
jgi:hypothetical protein